MSLVTCPDCTREVSDQAMVCPQCARPLRQPEGPAAPAAEPRTGSAGNILAALLSLVIPGCGQALQARGWDAGGFMSLVVLAWMVAGLGAVTMRPTLYLAVLIGEPLVHLWSAIDAAVWRGPDRGTP